MEILPLLNKNEKVSIKRGGKKIGDFIVTDFRYPNHIL